MPRGVVFNIQRYAVHDGPGIRTTVFLNGCPLDCAWCHNPEGRSSLTEVQLVPSRCIHCGACVAACPQGGPVKFPPKVPRFDEIFGGANQSVECTLCGSCVEACPSGARELSGRGYDQQELMEEILKDRAFYDDSGGGVTFSGGEPLAQAEFVGEMLDECRRQGIHTALDTCGAADPEVLLTVAGRADLVLFDIKHMDPDKHESLTGRPNRQILSNLKRLAAQHPRVWIRIPVVPGCNDDQENLEATARLAASLKAVEIVCLLPYHPLDRDKRQRFGFADTLGPVSAPTRQRLEHLLQVVENAGAAARIGG